MQFRLSFYIILATFLQPVVHGWKSYCSPEPDPDKSGNYPIPDDVDCQSPVGNIQKCFCDRNEPIYKRCIKETLDELEPSTANSTIVYEISVILERVSQWPFLDQQVRELVWQLYDKVLWVRQEKFEQSNDRGFGSTKRFLSSIDRFMANSDANVTFLEGQNLGLLKRPKPKCDDQFGALGIADYGSHFGEMNSDAMEGALASIQVPVNVACRDQEEKAIKISAAISEEGVHFVLYRKAHFFVGDSTHPSNARFGRQTTDRNIRCKPGLFANEHRRVLSATVEGKNRNGSRDGGIAAKIRYRNKLPPLHGQSLVTWWNPHESFWSMNDTCKIVHNGQFMEADCPHLTDFTLLVDGMETDPSLCDGFLISLGYTLNMGSFLALFLLNAIYLIYKSPNLYERVFVQFLGDRLPKMQLDEQAMVYNLTLMFFYFSFGLFSDEGHTGGGGLFCRAVALFNYWLLLACILLTIFQAWRILKMFLWTVSFERAVIVATRPKIVMAISFGVPAFFCLIFGLTLDDFFYRNDEFCWIRPTYVWFSVVLPLTILVLNAAICSMIIGLRLFPNSCGMQNVLERHASATIRLSKGVRRKSRNKLTILLLMQFSLGMPWILQFATISIPHVTFTHFLFTLVNGSQGLILLSLFGFKQIQAWRTVRIKSKMENATMPTTPAAENNVNVFTNSIGMRIPVAKPLANVQQQNNEGREEK